MTLARRTRSCSFAVVVWSGALTLLSGVSAQSETYEGFSAGGLHYVAEGHGPVVVLIHAFHMDLREWDDVAPELTGYCLWAHYSAESGHMRMLRHLHAHPVLDLGLRLGEGSGAALAWPVIASAVKLLDEMASFESAGVSDRGAGR